MTVKIISDAPVFSRKVVCRWCCFRLEYTGVDVTYVVDPLATDRTFIDCPNKDCKREVDVPPWKYEEVLLRPEEEASKKTGETDGLWRKRGMGGKYLVLRRDGSVPEWPGFVIGAKDAAAPAALRAYADAAEVLGYDPRYVSDVRELAGDFEKYRLEHGEGDPTAVPHRKDDPTVVARMTNGGM